MNLQRPKRIIILDGDSGPSAEEHEAREQAEVARWQAETAEPVVGGAKEANVLQALDPFWTRGMVAPPAPLPVGER